MIFVDALLKRGAPWAGGVSCHMISDESVYELETFARQISIPPTWYQARSFPHFDLSPRLRDRALRRGAVELAKVEYVAAMRRFRAANPTLFKA